MLEKISIIIINKLTKLIATFFNDNEIDIYDADIFLTIQQFRLLFHNLDQNQKLAIKVFFHFVLTNELKDAKDIDKNKNYINDNSKCLWDFETIQCWADIVDDNVAILKRIIDTKHNMCTNWILSLRQYQSTANSNFIDSLIRFFIKNNIDICCNTTILTIDDTRSYYHNCPNNQMRNTFDDFYEEFRDKGIFDDVTIKSLNDIKQVSFTYLKNAIANSRFNTNWILVLRAFTKHLTTTDATRIDMNNLKNDYKPYNNFITVLSNFFVSNYLPLYSESTTLSISQLKQFYQELNEHAFFVKFFINYYQHIYIKIPIILIPYY